MLQSWASCWLTQLLLSHCCFNKWMSRNSELVSEWVPRKAMIEGNKRPLCHQLCKEVRTVPRWKKSSTLLGYFCSLWLTKATCAIHKWLIFFSTAIYNWNCASRSPVSLVASSCLNHHTPYETSSRPVCFLSVAVIVAVDNVIVSGNVIVPIHSNPRLPSPLVRGGLKR